MDALDWVFEAGLALLKFIQTAACASEPPRTLVTENLKAPPLTQCEAKALPFHRLRTGSPNQQANLLEAVIPLQPLDFEPLLAECREHLRTSRTPVPVARTVRNSRRSNQSGN